MDYRQSLFFKKIAAIKEQKNLSNEIINNNLLVIEEFLERQVKCKPGPLSECKQAFVGREERLAFENNNIYVRTNYCAHWVHDNPHFLLSENIIYANYDVLSFTSNFNDYLKEHENLTNEVKKKLYGNILVSINKILTSKNSTKGLYIYGPFGVGKTHLLKCVANSLALQNKKIVFITPNEIIKQAKAAISNPEGTEYYRLSKKCYDADVLILDDIGAESVSDWSRDEVLFGILNHRMEHKKLTFFSANKNIADLEKTYFNKKQIGINRNDELLKAARFAERIKALALECNLTGVNKRY